MADDAPKTNEEKMDGQALPEHGSCFVCGTANWRAIRARSELRLADGTVAAVGRGIYVEAPHLFEKAFYQEA